MHPGHGVPRLVPLFVALGLAAAAEPALALEAYDAPPAAAAPAAKKRTRKPTTKKVAPKSKATPETKVTRAKPARTPKQKSAAMINENVTLTPFPSHASAAKKALAQNRRDQLDDAEKAARGGGEADRWQTVLFHLRNLDARSDSEGCFWRLVAYYRLGQVERARGLRASCDFVPKDAALIEAEDERAASLQPPTTLAEQSAGQEPPAPVGNPAPYDGAAPARADR